MWEETNLLQKGRRIVRTAIPKGMVLRYDVLCAGRCSFVFLPGGRSAGHDALEAHRATQGTLQGEDGILLGSTRMMEPSV